MTAWLIEKAVCCPAQYFGVAAAVTFLFTVLAALVVVRADAFNEEDCDE